jgi:hypothetical protein
MDCPKCQPTEHGFVDCFCDLLISYANCEICLKYGDHCTCQFEYQFDYKYISESIVCPITYSVFKQPYIASDGYTYEKYAIDQWLLEHDSSPMTGLKLSHNILIPNLSIQSIIKNAKKRIA